MGRKKYSEQLKAQIALDGIKGQKTIAEIASEYGVHYIVVVHLIGRYC